MRPRAVLAAAVLAAIALAAGGSLLSRIDELRAQDRAHAAQLRLTSAQLRLAIVRSVRDLDGDGDPDIVSSEVPAQGGVVWYANPTRKASGEQARVELLERRTTALRAAILALVRTGTAAMPGDPGWEWASWR